MKKFKTTNISIIILLIFANSILSGQPDTVQPEYELLFEESDPDAQLFLTETGLLFKLVNQESPFDEHYVDLLIEADDEIIKSSQVQVRNMRKSYLEPSTISHRASYSIILAGLLPYEQIIKIISSKNNSLRVVSPEYNREWKIKNTLGYLKEYFAEKESLIVTERENDLSVVELTKDDKSDYEVDNGVLIVSIKYDGIFQNSGLELGSIIIQINGVDINSAEQTHNTIKELKNTTAVFSVRTASGELKFININIP